MLLYANYSLYMSKLMYPTDINNNMPIIHGYKNDNNAITVNPLYDFLVPDAFSTFLQYNPKPVINIIVNTHTAEVNYPPPKGSELVTIQW